MPLICTLAILVSLTCLTLLLGGYVFGADDHETDLAIVGRIMDANHLPNDWYVDTQGVATGVRYNYALIIATTARFVPLHVAYAVWYAALLFALLGASFHLGRTIQGSWRGGVCSSLVMAVSIVQYKAALGYALWPNALVSQCFATVIAAWAYALYFRGSLLPALLLAAIGPWIHGQAGNHPLILLVLLACWEHQCWRSRLRVALPAAILIALPIEIQLYRNAVNGASLDVFLNFLHFRLPHHYLPSAWHIPHVLAIVSGALLVIFHRSASHPAVTSMRRLTLILLVLSSMFILSAQFAPIEVLIKAHFARHAAIVVFFAAAVIGGWLADRARRPVDFIFATLLVFPALLFSTSCGLEYLLVLVANRWRLGTRAIAAIGGLGIVICMLNSGPPGLVRHWIMGGAALSIFVAACLILVQRLPRKAGTPLAVLAAIGSIVLIHPRLGVDWRTGGMLHAFHITLRGPKTPVEVLSRVAAQKTPAGSVLVLPPQVERACLFSHRACVVSFKSNPHMVQFIPEWMRRMHDCAYGEHPPDAAPMDLSAMQAAYRLIRSQDLIFLRDRYGATHAILPSNAPAADSNVIARIEDWSLIGIPPAQHAMPRHHADLVHPDRGHFGKTPV